MLNWQASCLNTARLATSGPLPARGRPANGPLHLWTGKSMSTATAPSSSSRRRSGTAAWPVPSAIRARSFTNGQKRAIQGAGHGQCAAGLSRLLCGLFIPQMTRQQRIGCSPNRQPDLKRNLPETSFLKVPPYIVNAFLHTSLTRASHEPSAERGQAVVLSRSIR